MSGGIKFLTILFIVLACISFLLGINIVSTYANIENTIAQSVYNSNTNGVSAFFKNINTGMGYFILTGVFTIAAVGCGIIKELGIIRYYICKIYNIKESEKEKNNS